MPALDLALGLGMARGAADMAHLFGLDIFRQFAHDAVGAIVAQQSGLVDYGGAVAAGSCKGDIQRIGDILGPHVGAQLPGLPGSVLARGVISSALPV